MNKLFKSIPCLLTMLIFSTSGFCSGSNTFGIGLLLGTSKSKISNINEIKSKYNALYMIQALADEFKETLQDIKRKSNPFSEKSEFKFDTGVIAFYQHNFNNTFFARVGAFCSVPVAKNTFSFFNETISAKLRDFNANIDLNLKHSFDVGGQLLIGFNIIKMLSFVIGGELGYTKGKLELSMKANHNNNILKIYDEASSFGSLFGGGICGIEFNFNNVVIGVHGFLHSIKLNDSSFKSKDDKYKDTKTKKDSNDISLKVMNVGVRLMVAYKF